MNSYERNENREKIKTMYGYEVHWVCIRLIQCYKIFIRNSEELIRYSTNPPKIHYNFFPNIKSRIQKNNSDCEVVRLIHNYVASAKTLVDNSRRSSKKYLSEKHRNEYNKIISDTFANDSCTQIIHNLRNFILHVDMPNIINQINIYTGESFYLSLPPDKLIKWDNWKPIERDYLQNLINIEETIVIDEFFSGYTLKVKNITNVLLKNIIDNNCKDLSDVYDLHEKILEGVKADNYITDPLFVHFFSRNERYNEDGKLIPIFNDCEICI